jgi:hypothetical protein
VTLLEEGLLAMRGCWRLLWRDPAAFEDFNFTIDGFWRSFAMLGPLLILSYPLFISNHQFAIEFSEAGEPPPELRLGLDYLYLFVSVMLWPVAAAALAWLLGVAHNYVRYMIIYNWMAVPTTALAIVPHLLHLLAGAGPFPIILAQAVFAFSLYVSWYIARVGFETTVPVASAFLLADFAFTFGLDALIR